MDPHTAWQDFALAHRAEPEQVPLYHAPEHLKGQQTLDLVAQMRERYGLNLCHQCGLDLDGNPPDCNCDN